MFLQRHDAPPPWVWTQRPRDRLPDPLMLPPGLHSLHPAPGDSTTRSRTCDDHLSERLVPYRLDTPTTSLVSQLGSRIFSDRTRQPLSRFSSRVPDFAGFA